MINRPLQHSLALPATLIPTSSHLPPTFLLPFRAHLTTTRSASTTTTTTANTINPNDYQPYSHPIHPAHIAQNTSHLKPLPTRHPQTARFTPFGKTPLAEPTSTSPDRSSLLALAAQKPHYIVAHLHARPYLLTEGDKLRLPFLMPDADIGTIIRFNRASLLGSRDFTFRARTGVAAAAPGDVKEGAVELAMPERSKGDWIDEKYFSCRALVVGVEGEPMRVHLKTKRRQRHIQRRTHKMRFTVLRIIELRVTPDGDGGRQRVKEIDGQEDGQEADETELDE